jgi:uncharacterized membrane protein
MSWAAKFGIRQYLRGSLWILPLLGGVLGALLGEAAVLADKSVELPASWTYSASTASTVLSAIVGAMAALTGFVVTVTTLVVQMATGTFSARYMRLWYRDRMLKAVLALLIGTLAFSFALLRKTESNFVPNLGVTLAGLLVVVSLLAFLVFLDRYLHRLRPVAVAVLVAKYAERNFRPHVEAIASAPDVFWGVFDPGAEQPVLGVHSAKPGAIQAIDARGLVRWAREHERLVAVRHTIGDFVPAGAKLIEVYGGEPLGPREERRLRGMVALGAERTVEQDAAFAIRILVDIAEKGLSPAVNDPTTAVQVMDHLSDVLRLIGTVDLGSARWTGEHEGRTALIVPIRLWEDYLALATTEIREYGASSIQVMRRMRALLEELHGEVPHGYRAAVEEELARLDATVTRSFGDSVDLDRASTPDAQGIGGRTTPRALSR